jgi:hypothetical protein
VVYKSDAKNLHLVNNEKNLNHQTENFVEEKKICHSANNVTAKRINKPYFIISWFLKSLPGFRSTNTHRKNATE